MFNDLSNYIKSKNDIEPFLKNHLDKIDGLVVDGLDINELVFSESLLIHAVSYRNMPAVKKLLSLGADINAQSDAIYARYNMQTTVLVAAAVNMDIEIPRC